MMIDRHYNEKESPRIQHAKSRHTWYKTADFVFSFLLWTIVCVVCMSISVSRSHLTPSSSCPFPLISENCRLGSESMVVLQAHIDTSASVFPITIFQHVENHRHHPNSITKKTPQTLKQNRNLASHEPNPPLMLSLNIPLPTPHHPKRPTHPFALPILNLTIFLPKHISQIPHHAFRPLPSPKVASGVVVAVENDRSQFAVPGGRHDAQLAGLVAVADGDMGDVGAGAGAGCWFWGGGIGRGVGGFVVDAEGGSAVMVLLV